MSFFADGEAVFTDLVVTGMATGARLEVSCQDDQDFSQIGTSVEFNVHPFPRTGNLKETSVDFSYSGQAKHVQKVMNAFAAALTEDGTSSARKRRALEYEEVEAAAPVLLSAETVASWPIF